MRDYCNIQARKKYRESGTVGGTVVVLLILGLIVLCVVRYFWVDGVQSDYNALIRVYIQETPSLEASDAERLKEQLLEPSLFIKVHRWDKKSFIKDKELYDKMVRAYKERQRRIQDAADSTIDALINL
jgi:hypothetical protein